MIFPNGYQTQAPICMQMTPVFYVFFYQRKYVKKLKMF